MDESQKHELFGAMMLIEVGFGFGGEEWKKFPEFAGLDESDMAFCAHALIQHVAIGSECEDYEKAKAILKASSDRANSEDEQ